MLRSTPRTLPIPSTSACLLLAVLAACSRDTDRSIFETPARASAVGDSVGGPPSVTSTADPGTIELPVSATLRITLLERNAAWWHALYVEHPEELLIEGPGYLFPGPSFDVGPYGPGSVVLRLDSYDPREPHGFLGTAAQRVTGSFPNWIVEFEDGFDGDFDDIIVGVEAITASALTLVCTPATVVRTESTSCVPTAGPDSDVEVTGWRFVGGPNDEFEIVPSSGAPEVWGGPMVVGGTVWVYANVDGVADSAHATVTVTPRSWPNPPMDTPEMRDGGPDMNPIPQADHDLGHAHQEVVHPEDYPNNGYLAAVQSGPNFLLFYNDAPPVERIAAWTEINRDALTNRSNPWHQLHPNGRVLEGGVPVCRQNELRSSVLNIVIQHEADHQNFARQWLLDNNLNQSVEEVVTDEGLQALVNRTADVLIERMTAMNDANRAAVDPVSLGCKLRFF